MKDLHMIAYRRFIQMFSDVVMEVEKPKFEEIFDEIKEENGVEFDTDLTADDLKELLNNLKNYIKKKKVLISHKIQKIN